MHHFYPRGMGRTNSWTDYSPQQRSASSATDYWRWHLKSQYRQSFWGTKWKSSQPSRGWVTQNAVVVVECCWLIAGVCSALRRSLMVDTWRPSNSLCLMARQSGRRSSSLQVTPCLLNTFTSPVITLFSEVATKMKRSILQDKCHL